MALRTIRLAGDEILRKVSRPVKETNEKIIMLLDDMAETMYNKDGVGIAAPQVGVLRRIVVVDTSRQDEDSKKMELINPVILEQEGGQINGEGCLSIPGEMGYVERPEKIKVKALDRYGAEQIYEAEGFLAVAICHEIDHLDGILYTDKQIDESELEDIDETEEAK